MSWAPTLMIERCRQSVVAGIICILAVLAPAQTRPAAPAEKPAVSVQLIALHTSDSVRLDGVLYQPLKPTPVGLMLVHGYGGTFYGAYFRQLGQAAAEQGITTLALNMRDHDNGPKASDFTDNQTDIATGVAHLRSLGLRKIVLLGQSMGANRVLYYEAAAADPVIAATVLVSGPGNLFQWNVWQFGREKAQESVDEALRLRAAGHDRDLMLVDLGPLGKALYTPRYLLSLRGPEAKSDPYQNISKVKNPVLILQGKADKLIEPDIAERLQKAAADNPKVTVIHVEGADHGFGQHQSVLVERVLGWIKSAVPE
jgi:pimeloyl-ACP methyl ester carboxylesterase